MPSIGQNLHPFIGNGDVSIWILERDDKTPNKQISTLYDSECCSTDELSVVGNSSAVNDLTTGDNRPSCKWRDKSTNDIGKIITQSQCHISTYSLQIFIFCVHHKNTIDRSVATVQLLWFIHFTDNRDSTYTRYQSLRFYLQSVMNESGDNRQFDGHDCFYPWTTNREKYITWDSNKHLFTRLK